MNPSFQTYTAKLSEKKVYTERFIQLRCELVLPSRLAFQAGQYLILTVPGDPKRKSYSICSDAQTQHAIELLIDISPDGAGSRYLATVEVGEDITFMAPFGRFILPAPGSPEEQQEQSLAFIATGSGIAPIRSQILDLLLTRQDTRPMTLYWGMRYSDDFFWLEDFELLAQEHPNFTFHPVLSRPGEDWPLCRGRVTDCLSVHELLPSAGYYVCGNSDMITDTASVLQKRGVPAERIHHEKFN